MSLILLVIVLVLLFGGGGYYGHRRGYYGGGGLSGILGLLLMSSSFCFCSVVWEVATIADEALSGVPIDSGRADRLQMVNVIPMRGRHAMSSCQEPDGWI